MSRTIRAQKMANETNLQIAQEQNDLNYKMFNEQNDWNYNMWKEENLYNSPSAQMQRYLEAGINPLWAISGGNPGNAQLLQSAQAQPAVGAAVIPEYDPAYNSNLIAAAQNVSNSLEGFVRLGLEAKDVETRASSQKSQEALNLAQALFTKSQTKGQDFLNNLNLSTADALIGIKFREFEHLGVQIENDRKAGKQIDAQIDNLKEQKNQIIAMTDLTNKQANAVLDQVRQGYMNIALSKQRADTEFFVANSNSYYQGQDLKLRGQQFEFEQQKTIQQLNSMTNDQILKWYDDQRGYLDRIFGTFGAGVLQSFPGTDISRINQMFWNMKQAGDELKSRFESSPTESNYKSYMEWQNSIESIPKAPSVTPAGNSANPSILNPSFNSWNPWNE